MTNPMDTLTMSSTIEWDNDIGVDSYAPNNIRILRDYLHRNTNDPDRNRSLQQQASASSGGYAAPSFEGYLGLGFSIHVPCEEQSGGDNDCRLEIDGNEQARLESLVMLFLCSQGAELVISTAPGTLLHVCPFNNNASGGSTGSSSQTLALTKSASADLNNGEPMIVWNLPRFDSRTVAFDDNNEGSQDTTVIDMATDTTYYTSNGQPQPRPSQPKQYYTQMNFTYPVYQWGDQDPSVADSLQNEFDSSVVETGTLNALLPWQNSVAAATGSEPHVFWDEPLPAPTGFYDTEIPLGVGRLLQYIGGTLMVLNTLSCVLLAHVSRWDTRRRKEKARRKTEERRLQSGVLPSDYLDTEAGVSAILMESKHYALTKSGVFDTPASVAGGGGNNHDDGSVGVEVVNHHARSVSPPGSGSGHSRYNHLDDDDDDHRKKSPSKSAKEKEDTLLARAKQSNSYMSSTQWFSGKLLGSGQGSGNGSALGGTGASGDEYDDEEAEDLQILNLGGSGGGGTARDAGESKDVSF